MTRDSTALSACRHGFFDEFKGVNLEVAVYLGNGHTRCNSIEFRLILMISSSDSRNVSSMCTCSIVVLFDVISCNGVMFVQH